MAETNSNIILYENNEILLFQCAIHLAEQGDYVWYISPHSITSLPNLWKRPPSKEVLKLIIFIYVPEKRDFITKLNELHNWHKIPKAIIVNGIESYASLENDSDVINSAFLLATLIDATRTFSNKYSKTSYLIISCDTAFSNHPKFKTLIDLYFAENSSMFEQINEDTLENVLKCLSN